MSGQKEYMWVEVLAWGEKEIQGVLLNDAYYIESLRAGKRVEIPLNEIFDYIHYKPDGTAIGNKTGELIQKAREKR